LFLALQTCQTPTLSVCCGPALVMWKWSWSSESHKWFLRVKLLSQNMWFHSNIGHRIDVLEVSVFAIARENFSLFWWYLQRLAYVCTFVGN